MEGLRRTRSYSSQIRIRYFSVPFTDSNHWCQAASTAAHTINTKNQGLNLKYYLGDNKAHEPQSPAPSVCSEFRSIMPCDCVTLWKQFEKSETSCYEKGDSEVVADGASPEIQGFSSSPPVAPVTVLTRNVKGVWTKFKVPAIEDDLVWPTTPTPTVLSNNAADRDKSRSFVQHFLMELITSLPMLPDDADNDKKTQTESSTKETEHSSDAPSRTSPVLHRSQSIQTVTHTDGFQDDPKNKSSPNKQTKSTRWISAGTELAARRLNCGEGPIWTEGMRALRDAHVRLVLRQLRHVERLNRALDRRARKPARHATQ